MTALSPLKRWLRDARARSEAAELEARAELRSIIAGRWFWPFVLIVIGFTLYLYSQGRLIW
jgi:hypothetical protein